MFRSLSVICFIFIDMCKTQLTCRIEGNVDESIETQFNGRTSQSIIGPPGKQGPRGPPGDVTTCNCTDFTDIQLKLQEVENKLDLLQS